MAWATCGVSVSTRQVAKSATFTRSPSASARCRRTMLDSRTTSCGSNTSCSCRWSSPRASSSSSSAARRPSSWRGLRTEDSGTAAAAAKSMSSYPTIAKSSGTRDAVADHLLQQAQGDQVVGADGRRRAARRRHADDQLAGLAAAGDGEVLGERTVRASSDRSASRTAGSHALVALLHLRQPGRAADEGDPPVTALEQVVGGEPAAVHVVDRDRALVGAGARRSTRTTGTPRARSASRAGEGSAVGVMRTPCTRCSASTSR